MAMGIGNTYSNLGLYGGLGRNQVNRSNKMSEKKDEIISKLNQIGKGENVSQTENVELTEEEKLEAFKKEIWKEIDSWPRHPMVSESIRITDGGFKRMMEDEEFKNKVMGLMREDALVGRPPIVFGMTNVDEHGYSGVAYNDYNMGKGAFEAHTKSKDSFYVKRADKRYEEKKKLEEEELEKALRKRATRKAYFDGKFEHQRQMHNLFNKNLQNEMGIPVAQTTNTSSMAIAAYEQNSIIMPIDMI